jgi:hypothetical protein
MPPARWLDQNMPQIKQINTARMQKVILFKRSQTVRYGKIQSCRVCKKDYEILQAISHKK